MPSAVIVHTSDLHGQYTAVPRLFSLVERLRAGDPERVLLLDSGDTFADADEESARITREMFARLGPAAGTVGDGDDARWRELPPAWPLLAHRPSDYPFATARHQTLSAGGVRLGILGAAGGKAFDRSRVQDDLKKLAGVDAVVFLSHLGLERDLQVAKAVPEIDLILGGHDHRVLPEPLRQGETLICQVGGHGHFAGVLELHLGPDGLQMSHRLASLDTEAPEPAALRRALDRRLTLSGRSRRLGESIGLCRRRMTGSPRDWETEAGNLAADAMRSAARTDAALMLTRSLRHTFSAGEVRVYDACDLIYQDLPIYVYRMSGEQLHEVIAHSLVPDPQGNPVHFAFSGLEVAYRRAGNGAALHSISRRGQPVRPHTHLTVAVDEFVAKGPRFPMMHGLIPERRLAAGTIGVVVDYIERLGTIGGPRSGPRVTSV